MSIQNRSSLWRLGISVQLTLLLLTATSYGQVGQWGAGTSAGHAGTYGYVPVHWRRWPDCPAAMTVPETVTPRAISPEQLFEEEMPGQPQPKVAPPADNPFKDDPTAPAGTPNARRGEVPQSVSGSTKRRAVEIGDRQTGAQSWQFNPLAPRPRPLTAVNPLVDEPAGTAMPAAEEIPIQKVAVRGSNPLRAAHHPRLQVEDVPEPTVEPAAESPTEAGSEPSLLTGDPEAAPISDADSAEPSGREDTAPAVADEPAPGWSLDRASQRLKAVDQSDGRSRWRRELADSAPSQPASFERPVEPGPQSADAENPLRRTSGAGGANPLRAR